LRRAWKVSFALSTGILDTQPNRPAQGVPDLRHVAVVAHFMVGYHPAVLFQPFLVIHQFSLVPSFRRHS